MNLLFFGGKRALRGATVATMASDSLRAIVLKPNTETALIQLAINEGYNVVFFQTTMPTECGTIHSRGVVITEDVASIASLATVVGSAMHSVASGGGPLPLSVELAQWTVDQSGLTATDHERLPVRARMTDIMRVLVAEWIKHAR